MSDTRTNASEKVILDCQHAPKTPTVFHSTDVPLTTGYAVLPNGANVCYDCADAYLRIEMAHADTFTAYVSADENSLTTWTGGELARTIDASVSRNGFNRSFIYSYRFVTRNGVEWYGRNAGPGMAITVRRAKRRSSSAFYVRNAYPLAWRTDGEYARHA